MNDDYSQPYRQNRDPLLGDQPYSAPNQVAGDLNQGFPQRQDNLQNPQPLIDIDQQRLNAQKLKKKAEGYIGEIFYTSMIMLTCIIFASLNKNNACSVPIKMWLGVHTGVYLSETIVIMYQYHWLKKNKKENLFLLGARFLNLVVISGWLVYGNVLYFNKSTEGSCMSGLRLGLFIMLLVGYIEMMKCFCLTIFLCILIPVIFFAVRRSQRPNWMPAAPQFIQQLYNTKFNPAANQAQETCPICMVDFTETDDIIPLPCDEKHYFHPECIKQWLQKNNNCPLCKKEVTKEALKEQKRKLKEQQNIRQ